jgi:ATP-binding cassette subfamily C protein CydD
LKLLGRSQAQVRTIRRISDQFRRSTLEVLRIAFLSALALELLATISVAIIAVEIGLRLLYGGIDFERALFILILAPEFYMPLRALGTSFHAGTEGKAAAERIFAILDAPVTQWGSQPAPAAPFSIAFESVTYRYEGNGHPAVEDVSFAVAPGELVALVGPSGAGKTTLASMLLGFIKSQAGTIRVNGVPLADIDPDSWRSQVAWVPQHPYLFNTSVLENIRLAMPDASIEAVKRAAELAFAAEFIALLPDGYATVIGEHGARLSGGQAQRIALARAFLKDAPVLIMDEATSSLDPAQETLVQQAVARLVEDRTALVITHRLNTAYQADHIVVLAQGRVSQIGTHTVLRAQPGIYRSLVANYTGVEAGA